MYRLSEKKTTVIALLKNGEKQYNKIRNDGKLDMENKTKILVIGASSYVGARIYFDLKSKFDVFGTYFRHQLSTNFVHIDITDKEEVEKVISEHKPTVIIHVANNASARWCEANSEKAVLLNQTATQFVVDSANKVGAVVI